MIAAQEIPLNMSELHQSSGHIYDIPRDLYRRDTLFSRVNVSTRYQVSSGDINIGDMLEYIRHQIPLNAIDAIKFAKESPFHKHTEYYSFLDLPRGRKHFTGILGAVKLDDTILPRYKEFYLSDSGYESGRLFRVEDGRNYLINRGKRYYVAVDDKILTPADKINTMNFDMVAAAKVLRGVDRSNINSAEELLQYLGVLDYLKQHSLGLFHAITYPERFASFEEDDRYNINKQKMWANARQFTRLYYQALWGVPFDSKIELESLIYDFQSAGNAFLASKPESYQIKLQEVDHPLVLSLAAYQTVNKHPNANTLISLPSGGTQFGFITELLYEYLRKDKGEQSLPILLPIALSTHAAKRGNGALINTDILINRLLRMDFIYGWNVLVLDDNSNTGETLQMVVDALESVGANRVNVSLAEVDPKRIIDKQMSNKPPDRVANLMHPDICNTVISTTPIINLPEGGHAQVRKILARIITGSLQ